MIILELARKKEIPSGGAAIGLIMVWLIIMGTVRVLVGELHTPSIIGFYLSELEWLFEDIGVRIYFLTMPLRQFFDFVFESLGIVLATLYIALECLVFLYKSGLTSVMKVLVWIVSAIFAFVVGTAAIIGVLSLPSVFNKNLLTDTYLYKIGSVNLVEVEEVQIYSLANVDAVIHKRQTKSYSQLPKVGSAELDVLKPALGVTVEPAAHGKGIVIKGIQANHTTLYFVVDYVFEITEWTEGKTPLEEAVWLGQSLFLLNVTREIAEAGTYQLENPIYHYDDDAVLIDMLRDDKPEGHIRARMYFNLNEVSTVNES